MRAGWSRRAARALCSFAGSCSLVASGAAEEHLSHLRLLFERLNKRGLIVNPAKSQFGRVAVDFLGHRVTPAGGDCPASQGVEAVTAFPRPRTLKPLQEFLGMVNF